MSDGYTDVFDGPNVSPAQLGYAEYTTAVDIQLVWPAFEIDGSFPAAQKVDINATTTGLNVALPQANQVTVGQDILIRNIGVNPFTVTDFAGTTITVPGSGQQWFLWIVDNSTMPGVWAQVQFGTGTSSASAGSLAGAGLRANMTRLDQNLVTVPSSGNRTVTANDRATVAENTGGVVNYTFDTVANLGGNGWFVYTINSGSGSMTLTATGCTIDGSATKVLAPTESAIIFCDGTNLHSLGYGRSIVSVVTGAVISLGTGGTTTLSSSQVAAQVQDWTGALVSNAIVEYGASVGYWFVNNGTTGAFTTTARTTVLDPGVLVAQGSFSILRSNGTNMSIAFTSSGGTVTSVAGAAGEITGGPITTSGTLGLANTAVTPGTYGDISHVPRLVIDGKGRITGATLVALGSAAGLNGGGAPGNVPVLNASALVPPENGGTFTGMIVDCMITPPAGWIFACGTIGDGASGATNRANADCVNLFTAIYNSYPNSTAPVSGGRGANAAADFAAHKTIAVADFRGRARVGRDNMLIGAAGRVTNATATPDGQTMGAIGGSQQESTTVTVAGPIAGSASGTVTGTTDVEIQGFVAAAVTGAGAAQFSHNHPFTGAGTFTIDGGSTFAGGGTTALALNMPPFGIVNVAVKL